MKTLKLNSFESYKLERKAVRQILGGAMCGCACKGSSSENDNGTENQKGGKYSKGELKTNQTIFTDEVVITP
ncbi:TIGR04149 family rSAM-modified RiPP [Bacteroides oleiciplenus]|uniref:RSAM-modified peptide n=1 Tax=Bacteroides oleiciplenus TaxID=626931 RepID=A0A3E5B411_9BACE|nr:TIGR04149 family rSAM-modified RiPP [Bacteroides oleiciplenus]RGN32326.1 rSAM-modified peptide [Bacteroides oleiciplenus]